MNIAILTLPLSANNYGGIMQNYALQTVLKQMGHSPCTIDYDLHLPLYIKVISIIHRAIRKYVFRENIILRTWQTKEERDRIYRLNNQFVERYINIVRVDSLHSIENLSHQYDAIIVGSDQVWRRSYIRKYYRYFFLGFRHKKKVAYGASFGCEEWPYTQRETHLIKRYVGQIAYLSVREQSGRELCTAHLGVCPLVVLDPVLLLSESHYKALLSSSLTDISGTSYSGRLVTYFLDPNDEKEQITRNISLYLGFYTYTLMPSSGSIGIEKWLEGLHGADCVLTDSYHGVLFSILFHKQFLVFLNRERGIARFSQILSQLDILDRIISESDSVEVIATKMSQKLNWDHIETLLDVARGQSFDFIRKSIQ